MIGEMFDKIVGLLWRRPVGSHFGRPTTLEEILKAPPSPPRTGSGVRYTPIPMGCICSRHENPAYRAEERAHQVEVFRRAERIAAEHLKMALYNLGKVETALDGRFGCTVESIREEIERLGELPREMEKALTPPPRADLLAELLAAAERK